MEPDDIAVKRGSGNVFADLGFPDADAHLVKAELVSRIDDIVRDRGLTQTAAGRLMGLSQPDVSRLLGATSASIRWNACSGSSTRSGATSTSSSASPAPPTAHGCASPPPNPPDRSARSAGRRCAAGPAPPQCPGPSPPCP